MKKNISINICGTIYAIDEDAYQLLENYLQSMKNYFRNEEGGDEIADDIEHRVAELLDELAEGIHLVGIGDVVHTIHHILVRARQLHSYRAVSQQHELLNQMVRG